MADDLRIEELQALALASVMARREVAADALGRALGAPLGSAPRVWRCGEQALIGTGPGTWLAVAGGGPPFFAERLAERLAGLAAVSDQSDGYCVLRLSGPGARLLLQRGAPIDLHDAAFGPGAAATTVIAHIGVILWREGAAPVFHVALFRSLAHSFRQWLDRAAAAL